MRIDRLTISIIIDYQYQSIIDTEDRGGHGRLHRHIKKGEEKEKRTI